MVGARRKRDRLEEVNGKISEISFELATFLLERSRRLTTQASQATPICRRQLATQSFKSNLGIEIRRIPPEHKPLSEFGGPPQYQG
jgi:hypothetical protein